MTDLNEDPNSQTRLNQMEPSNIEYRLQRLEEERLPTRVHTLELTVQNMQGEVVAVKEIARGIGVKLDAGVKEISTDMAGKLEKLSLEQAKAQSFQKGVMWLAGGIVTMVVIGPIVGTIVKKLLGV